MFGEPSEPSPARSARHGKPQFEDGWQYRHNRWQLSVVGCIFFFFGSVFTIMLLYDLFVRGTAYWLNGMGTCATVLGLVFLYVPFTQHPFRIYEDGISFTVPRYYPFLPFDQVHFITTGEGDELLIYRKALTNRPLSIVSVSSRVMSPDERIGDWPRFYETLKRCLLKARPDKSERYLIREFDNVEWAPDAVDALDNRLDSKWNRFRVWRHLTLEVLQQGRYRVELDDVRKYLK